LKYVECCTH